MTKLGFFHNKWMVFIGLTLSYCMVYLDQSVVTVSLETIHRNFHTSETDLSWIMNGYLLTLSLLVLTGGKLGDIVGFRIIYHIGIVIFSVSSILCGLAWSPISLIVFRGLEGIGAALMLPIPQAVIYHLFPSKHLGKVMSIYAGSAVFFLTMGPLIGGFLIKYLSWRYVFWINPALGFFAIILTCSHVIKFAEIKKSVPYDFLGQILFISCFAPLIFALMEYVRLSITSPWIWGSFILFALSTPLFIWHQLKTSHPFIELRLLCNKPFLGSMWTFFTIQFCWLATIYLVLYFQRSLSYTPLEAGLGLFFILLPQIILNPIAGIIADKFTSRLLMLIGTGSLTLAFLWLAIFSKYLNIYLLFVGFLLMIIGQPSGFISAFKSAMKSISADKQGEASGMGFAFRQMGGSVGLALMTIVSLIAYPPLISSGLNSSEVRYAIDFSWTMLVPAIACLSSFITSYFLVNK